MVTVRHLPRRRRLGAQKPAQGGDGLHHLFAHGGVGRGEQLRLVAPDGGFHGDGVRVGRVHTGEKRLHTAVRRGKERYDLRAIGQASVL